MSVYKFETISFFQPAKIGKIFGYQHFSIKLLHHRTVVGFFRLSGNGRRIGTAVRQV